VVIWLICSLGPVNSGLIKPVASGAMLLRLPDLTFPVQFPAVKIQWDKQSPGHSAPLTLPGMQVFDSLHHPQKLELEQMSQSVMVEQMP